MWTLFRGALILSGEGDFPFLRSTFPRKRRSLFKLLSGFEPHNVT
jgi:hypothetical protein